MAQAVEASVHPCVFASPIDKLASAGARRPFSARLSASERTKLKAALERARKRREPAVRHAK
jgi:hypothetical protein